MTPQFLASPFSQPSRFKIPILSNFAPLCIVYSSYSGMSAESIYSFPSILCPPLNSHLHHPAPTLIQLLCALPASRSSASALPHRAPAVEFTTYRMKARVLVLHIWMPVSRLSSDQTVLLPSRRKGWRQRMVREAGCRWVVGCFTPQASLLRFCQDRPLQV